MYPLIPGSAFKCVHVGVTVYSIQRASVEVEVFECVHLLPQSVNGGFVFGLCVCVRVRVRVCACACVCAYTLPWKKKIILPLVKNVQLSPRGRPICIIQQKSMKTFKF